jgi:hypothetical protein
MTVRILALGALACVAVTAAVDVPLDPRAVTEAIAIGQSRNDRDRTRFHAPYRLPVNRSPIDYVDVVTPFRRVVLMAQSRAQIGDRSFGQRQALAMLDEGPAQIDIRVELTFHPLNTYVSVPSYQVSLVAPRGTAIEPQTVDRLPRYGARVDGLPLPLPVPGGSPLPGGSEPMLGGTVVAAFDGRSVDPLGMYEVVIEEAGQELARVRLDLATLR